MVKGLALKQLGRIPQIEVVRCTLQGVTSQNRISQSRISQSRISQNRIYQCRNLHSRSRQCVAPLILSSRAFPVITASVHNGSALIHNGAVCNSPIRDGSAYDGSVNEGSAYDGSVNEGCAYGGSVKDGSGNNSSANNGSANNASSYNGSANGSANGSVDGSVNGSVNNASPSNGSVNDASPDASSSNASDGSGQTGLSSDLETVLDNNSVLDAFACIRHRYSDRGKLIPGPVMARFYDICAADKTSTVTPFFFSELVTVSQVGQRHFAANCDRLVKLLLAADSYESCIAFIREVEVANQGELMLSYDTLESLLLAAKWHGDADMAMQAMQILVASYSNVYARTWGLFLQLALDTRSYEALKWIHKTALVPGLLVIDDASYLRLAAVAAEHGDLRLCEWSSLRMRRRQRALGSQTTFDDSLKLYVTLIEAAAKSSVNSTNSVHPYASEAAFETTTKSEAATKSEASTKAESPAAKPAQDPLTDISKTEHSVSFQTVCRYLIRLGPLASRVSYSDLPNTVNALMSSQTRYNALVDIYNDIMLDPSTAAADHDMSPSHRHEAVKTFLFNLLLHVLLQKGALELARVFAFEGRDLGLEFNEDSILNFIDMAHQGGSDLRTLQALAIQCPTPRVYQRVKSLGKYHCT